MLENGWTFGDGVDPVMRLRHLHQCYVTADPSHTDAATVPVPWDKQASVG